MGSKPVDTVIGSMESKNGDPQLITSISNSNEYKVCVAEVEYFTSTPIFIVPSVY